jgi:hypothetical protein
MNWNQQILNKMMPEWWYKPWDLVGVYYDAPRRLRSMVHKGKVEKKEVDNRVYYKKLI